MLGGAPGSRLDVRVITDPTVSASRASAATARPRWACPSALYPVDDGRHQIDHVKLLIADDEAAVGGMNWGAHSDRNHDYVLETRVAVEVARLVRIFEQDWALAAGRPAPLAPVRRRSRRPRRAKRSARMLERCADGGASVGALAEVYTLTDPEVIAELADAHRRGVDVRVLLDPNQPYNRHAFDVLSAAGVAVRWYPVPAAPCCTPRSALFDGVLVLGSANWTYSGLGVNHELDIETADPERWRRTRPGSRATGSALRWLGGYCGGGPRCRRSAGRRCRRSAGRPRPWVKLTCGTARSPSSAWKKPKGLKPRTPAISEVGRVCSLML